MSKSTADSEVLIKHTGIKMIQAFSLATPPILIATSLYRRSFRLSPFLRNTALSTFIGGGAVGVGMGWAKAATTDAAGLEDRAYRLKMNVGQRRVDDYSVIGAVLGAIVTATIFLKRAPIPYLIAGGAAFGVAGGVITHVVKNYKDGTAQGVAGMVEEAKSIAKGES
ncbi:hypothetical protein RQP46_009600 [Phenoliferia psychrophenolica]